MHNCPFFIVDHEEVYVGVRVYYLLPLLRRYASLEPRQLLIWLDLDVDTGHDVVYISVY